MTNIKGLNLDYGLNLLPLPLPVSIEKGKIVLDTPAKIFQKLWNGRFRTTENVKLLAFVEHLWEMHSLSVPKESQLHLIKISDAAIIRLRGPASMKQQLNRLDFKVGIMRRRLQKECKKPPFLMSDNMVSFRKWIDCGFHESLFFEHPDFVAFLQSSFLASQIKVTRDSIGKVQGHPAILADGILTPFPALKERFCIGPDKLLRDRQTHDIYTYLDTGRGLVKHDPWAFKRAAPISKRTPEEYRAILETGRRFVRDEDSHLTKEEKKLKDRGRTCVLQIVGSYNRDGDPKHPLAGPWFESFSNTKHPFLRLVNESGEVHGVGYYRQRPYRLPLETLHGSFMCPDLFEYRKVDERIVTNIAVTNLEAECLLDYIYRIHEDSLKGIKRPSFNQVTHNCTYFIKMAVKASTNIDVPTEEPMKSIVRRSSPDYLQHIGGSLSEVAFKMSKLVDRVTPEIAAGPTRYVMGKVKGVARLAFSFISLLPLLALGGAMGVSGRKFDAYDCDKDYTPPLRKIQNWLSPGWMIFNCPVRLQEWQRQQPSTIIYKHTAKLAI